MSSSTNNDNNDATRNNNRMDGKQVATEIRAEIKETVSKMTAPPGLAVILVGSRRDSQTYVNMKKKACAAAGITSQGYDLDETVTQAELLSLLEKLNADDSVHGILVQLPLPAHLNQDAILRAVDPAKDVDGLHPANVAALQLFGGNNYADAPFSIPCTPLGCLELLDRYQIELRGKHCVVLGRSQLVGLPLARLLLGRDATVTVCHSHTRDLARMVRQADVVVAAVGQARLVRNPDWIQQGAVVIDVGINSVDVEPTEANNFKTYQLVGDVDFDAVQTKCQYITPVPGGVGPMTIAMLLRNTLRSCQRHQAAANDNEETSQQE